MKRILITGADSYIGTSFEKYMNCFSDYIVDTVDMKNADWKETDFSQYDTVFHVAGIAHIKETRENAELYYMVNRDLAVETAQKAKTEGVKQFVFLSSMAVYGIDIGVITKETVPKPKSNYGKSKLQAESIIEKLNDENFKVCVLRPPMIYGKNCKGNYPTLSRLAQKLPFFPYVNNYRSMLYIESLCKFVYLMVKNNECGIYYPQNAEYSSTTEIVKKIAQVHGNKIVIVKGLGRVLKIMSHLTGLVNKAFGSLCYDMSISKYKENYRVCGLFESIERTEMQ